MAPRDRAGLPSACLHSSRVSAVLSIDRVTESLSMRFRNNVVLFVILNTKAAWPDV